MCSLYVFPVSHVLFENVNKCNVNVFNKEYTEIGVMVDMLFVTF